MLLLSLRLLTEVELIIMVSSFEVTMESIWPWRSEASQTSEKGARETQTLQYLPKYMARRRSFVRRCRYFSFASCMDDVFSSFYTEHFFCEYLIHSSGNLYADSTKSIKIQ